MDTQDIRSARDDSVGVVGPMSTDVVSVQRLGAGLMLVCRLSKSAVNVVSEICALEIASKASSGKCIRCYLRFCRHCVAVVVSGRPKRCLRCIGGRR